MPAIILETISGLPPGVQPTGPELFAIVQGGVTVKMTAEQFLAYVNANLVSNIESVGDFDIANTESDKSYNISLITALDAGSRRRVSWLNGDGTYNFSFTGTSGIFIDGISAAQYVGQGVGHLDFEVIDSTHLQTVNSGEIWDSDGGKFGSDQFQKSLTGIINYTYQFGTIAVTSAVAAAGYRSNTQTWTLPVDPVSLHNISIIGNPSNTWGGAQVITIGSPTTIEYRLNANASRAAETALASAIGRWTTLFPRIS